MESSALNVVTGAFGYTGRHIAGRLLSMGTQVRTLTGNPHRKNPFGNRITVARLAFDNPAELAESLDAASTLYNTYWVRFAHGDTTFARAVDNSIRLIEAARIAGVRRIVHISITNPSERSSLPYFRGKAQVERALIESGLSYAIVRPTVIFGPNDILINNIAWLLRRFPVFAIPGSGDYRLQPVFVEDVAELAVRCGQDDTNTTTDAAGPDVYTFGELVRLVASAVRSRATLIHLRPFAVRTVARLIGVVLRDVVLTGDEMEGLMSNLLVSADAPTGRTPFSDWLRDNAATLGAAYASELDRHYR